MRTKARLCAALVALLLASSHASGRDRAHNAGPPICGVSMFARGLSPGYAAFDVHAKQIKAFLPDLSQEWATWGYLEAPVDEKGQRMLLDLIRSLNIRRFRPDARWFGEGKRNREGSVVMVVRWPRAELAMVMPPADVRLDVPATALAVYDRLDRLASLLRDVAKQYAQQKYVTQIPVTDERFARFNQRREKIFIDALPKDRRGW